jgi:hypothetical protein
MPSLSLSDFFPLFYLTFSHLSAVRLTSFIGAVLPPFSPNTLKCPKSKTIKIVRAMRRCCRRNDDDRSRIVGSCEIFWSDDGRTIIDVDVDRDADDDDDCDHRHRVDDDDRDGNDGRSFLVSMMRVATTTGEYWQDADATRLCVHPTYGTWTAFRAVVVFGTSRRGGSIPPSPPPPPPPPHQRPVVSIEEIGIAKLAFEYALDASSSNDGSRGGGYGTTVGKPWAELRDYLRHGSTWTGISWEKVPDAMKPWIRLRDCISVGRERWKYDDAQLLYHYTRDINVLSMELRRVRDDERRGLIEGSVS